MFEGASFRLKPSLPDESSIRVDNGVQVSDMADGQFTVEYFSHPLLYIVSAFDKNAEARVNVLEVKKRTVVIHRGIHGISPKAEIPVEIDSDFVLVRK